VIKASSGLSDEEVEQMVQDAEANAEEDRKFEELVQVRNTADGMIHGTRKTLTEAGDQATAEEKEAIEKAITELEEALVANDKDEIEAKTTALTEVSGSLAQKMYESAQAKEAAGEAGAEDAAQPQDDAVDAEFEEVKDEKK